MKFSKDGINFHLEIPYGKPHEKIGKAVKSLGLKLGDTLYVKQSSIAGNLTLTVDKGML